ncbi:MAG: peptidoglycan-binding domain-containing protein [Labedaea sp.]
MANEFDDQLHARLLAFQRANGLAEDGLAGAKTWQQLVSGAYSNAATDTQPESDHRSDAEITKELEQRTHKTIAELTIELGLGPITITPRELEARLIENHTLRPRLPDNSKHTVIDAVRERHEYMDGRFVTRGVVGRPDVVDRMKAAGEADERDQLQQNLATLAHGMGGVRVPPKSAPNAGPKPAPKSPANKGPAEFQKVDPKRVGGGKPANDHGDPNGPASGVVRAQPPVEHEPHGEIQLDTGTDASQPRPNRPVAASRRGPSRKGSRSPDDPNYWDDRYGDLDDDSPRRQRISDGNKTELENSAWLRRRLPDDERRRQFMKWLERRHDNRDGPHAHENPGSRELESSVRDFEAENP